MKSTAVDGSRVFHYTGQIHAKSIMSFAYRCAIMTIYSNQADTEAARDRAEQAGASGEQDKAACRTDTAAFYL